MKRISKARQGWGGHAGDVVIVVHGGASWVRADLIPTLGLFILLSLPVGAAEEAFVISKDHAGVIVLPEKPNAEENQADGVLAKYLAMVNGVNLKTVSWDGKAELPRHSFYLGRAAVQTGVIKPAEMKDLGYGGYIVRVKNGNVNIAGDKYGGITYGVYNFLEAVGMKLYTRNIVALPAQKDSLPVPAIDLKGKPFFEVRMCGDLRSSRPYMGKPDDPELTKKVGYLSPWHTTTYLVPFPDNYKEHPEYFAKLKSGKMSAEAFAEMGSTFIHVCMSNPGTRELARKRLLNWMNEQSERFYFDVSQADDNLWCYCDNCLKLDTVPGEVMTDRVLDWANDLAKTVAEKHPEKYITVLAYQATQVPPKRSKPAPNVRIWLCPYNPEIGCRGHWFDHKANRTFLPYYEGWTKSFPGQIYIFDYASGDIFTHEQMFYRIKQYAKDGVRGIYFCGTPQYFFRDLFAYVSDQLAWDPSQDTQALVDDFMGHYYGKAAPVMGQVYAFMKRIAAMEDRIQGVAADTRNFMKAEEYDDLLALLDKALALVENDELHRQRVNVEKLHILSWYLKSFNPVRRNVEVEDIPKFKSRLSEFLKKGKGGKKWLWDLTRLEIKAKDEAGFWKDSLVQQLINDPDSVPITKLPEVKIEDLGYGWKIPLERFDGAYGVTSYKWRCPRRQALHLIAGNIARATFHLDEAVPEAALIIEGQDDDGDGRTPLLITVNGKEIFRGPNEFMECGWSTWMWFLPKDLLVKGENQIAIHDLSESTNVFRGWFMVSGVWLEKRKPR